MTELPVLGGNDEERVWCALCRWETRAAHIEQIEFLLARHLQEAHGKRIYYRKNSTGERTDIPQLT